MIAERESTIKRELPLPFPTGLPRMPRHAPQHRVQDPAYRTPRPMGERGPRVVRRVRQFSWRSPMTAAVLFASFFVSLASFYVSAYARVALQSVQKAKLSQEIRAASLQEDALHAKISELTLGSMVQARASAMKMERNSTQSTELLLPTNSLRALAADSNRESAPTVRATRKIIQ